MATRHFKFKSDGILKGTPGSDRFVVNLDKLRQKKAELTDTGGDRDELFILDGDASWGAKYVVSTAKGVVWNGIGVGRIVIPVDKAGDSKIEVIRWGSNLEDIEYGLRLITDHTPDAGNRILIAGSHKADTIIAPDGPGAGSEIYGGQGADRITAGAGEDYTVYGGSGGDVIITPGPARGVFYGQTGKDALFGCSGADHLFGGGGADNLRGLEGNDRLNGGAQKDTLSGDTGADSLSGGRGKDRLDGGDGRDRLAGDKGRDTLSGGEGADVFVFTSGKTEGRNIITDFSDGEDKLLIKGGAFEDIKITQAGPDGTDTKLVFPDRTNIVLRDIDPDDITAADFLF